MEWININDRKPDKDMRCLVMHEKIQYTCHVAFYIEQEDYFRSTVYSCNPFNPFLTHWLEIPELSTEQKVSMEGKTLC